MGLTDNENPIGLMPFLMPGLGVGAGRRRRRDLDLPEPDMAPKDVPGGERLDESKQRCHVQQQYYALFIGE